MNFHKGYYIINIETKERGPSMESKRRQPLGVELVKKGVVSESDIQKALDYQRTNPGKKIGDILNTLKLCNPTTLIQAIGEILDEKGIYLMERDVTINITDYIALDICRKNKAVPFETGAGRIKVCFSDTSNTRSVEVIRLLLLNKGLVMEKYITFEENINRILDSLEGEASENIDTSGDVSGLVDSIIKTAIEKRARDIHIEPLDNSMRVRYRIDGRLVDAAKIENDKQSQIIGRLKAI